MNVTDDHLNVFALENVLLYHSDPALSPFRSKIYPDRFLSLLPLLEKNGRKSKFLLITMISSLFNQSIEIKRYDNHSSDSLKV